MAEIDVISPDGELGSIPEEQLADARAQGFRLPNEVPAAAPAPDAAPADAEVEVRAPDGSIGTVPASQLTDALDQGYEETRHDQYRTAGQKIATAAEGGLRGATMGISDLVQAGGAAIGTGIGNWLADREFGETPGVEHSLYDTAAQQASYADIQGRREANKALSVGTEIAGAAVPALLTGGIGSAAAMARATPAGQLASLSTKMLGELTKREGIGAMGRIGALAGIGAGEALVDNATRQVMDSLASGDVELSAERMLDGAWEATKAAALGGLVGGGLGAVAEGVSAGARGAQRLVDGVRGRGAQPAAGIADDAARAGREVIDEATPPAPMRELSADEVAAEAAKPVDPIAAQEARPLVSSQLPDADSTFLSKARAAQGSYDDALADGTRGIRKDLDDLLRDQNQIDEFAGIAAKRRAAKALDGWGRPVDGSEMVAVVDEVKQSTNGLVGRYGEAALMDRGGLATVKRVQALAEDAEKHIATKLKEGDLGSAYMAMDDLKRSIGRAANTKNPLAEEALKGIYGRVQGFLEDEQLWGELAQRQKLVNPAWTERIRRGNDSFVGGFFRRSGDAAADPFEALTQSNDRAIRSLLGELGKEGSEGTEEALRRYLRAAGHDAEQRAKAWGTPELVERAQRIQEASKRIEQRMDTTALLGRDAGKWSKTKQEVAEWTQSVPFLGALAKGGTWAAERAAEAQTSRTLQRLASAGVARERALGKAVETTLRNFAQGATTASAPIASRAVAAQQTPQNQQAVKNMVAQAQALQDPNSPESQQLSALTLQLASESPEFAEAMRAKVMKRADFLVQKLGPSIDPSDPLKAAPMPVDRVTKSRTDRFLRAAADPAAALDRLANGQGGAEDLQTVRELTPSIHKAYVDRVMQQVMGKGIKASQSQRQRLFFALGVPVERSQTPGMVAFYQSLHAGKQPENPDAAQGAPKPPNNTQDFDIDATSKLARSDAMMTPGGME